MCVCVVVVVICWPLLSTRTFTKCNIRCTCDLQSGMMQSCLRSSVYRIAYIIMYTPTHTVSLSIYYVDQYGAPFAFLVPELRLEVEFSCFSLI